MAIQEKWADQILCGRKTAEIRKRHPRFEAGTRVWIYVTKPVGEVRGWFVAGTPRQFDAATPSAALLRRACATEDDLSGYLKAAQIGWEIPVRTTGRLRGGVFLKGRGPMSFRYLRPETSVEDRRLLRRLRANARSD